MTQRAIVLTAATIVTGLVTAVLAPKGEWKLHNGPLSPMMNAGLVRSAQEIQRAYQGTRFRRSLEAATVSDFLFTASWASMFYAIGRMTGGRAGRAISLSALVAGLAGAAENIGILRILHADRATDALALEARIPSLVKWSVLGAVFLLTGISFQLQPGRDALRFLVGGCYLFAGMELLFGLFAVFDRDMMRHLPMAATGTVLQLVWLVRKRRLA